MYNNEAKEILEAQNGNHESMSKLVELNSGLIWSIVKRFTCRGFEIEDLYQIGAIGLIKSIKRFDTNFDVKLSTYAVPYILGEIRRYIQTEGPIKISRTIKELLYKISEVEKEYLKRGKEITIDEIAKEIGVSREDVVVALESKTPVNSIYERESNDEDGVYLIDKISSGVDEQKMITNKITLAELIKNLNEKEKQIILLRYFRGKTQSEVANIIGVNQVQVSRIERKVLDSMKRKLTDKDVITA